ncbi:MULTISPECIES: nucleotidyltransferase family protein [Sphingomonas]|uniref:nucleotidyltransferase family protein n=1 Tax=Sphingomonas TaxID=13687 RepID=UPI00082D83DB|nr:NTP transferase domain-containing protein [Sphingomonas sp. CCH10-B3]
MIRAESTMLVLLAAGRSLRFGETDKLAVDFLGRPLALHVVIALEAVPFAHRVAITSGTDLDFGAHGYRTVTNPAPEAGLSGSLRLGVAAAQAAGVTAMVVALADMPRVTAAQIFRLLDAASGPDDVIASSDGTRPSPPALFAAGRFSTLAESRGDEGGRALIRAGRHIVTNPAELIDIDTPEDLAALRALV